VDFHTNVQSITQKRMTLGYPRNDMVLGFQGRKLWLGLRQQQYSASYSMSTLWLFSTALFLVQQIKLTGWVSE